MNLSWVGLEIEDTLIERVLGEGGFSVVYLGTKKNGESLALKVAHSGAVTLEQQTGCFNTLAQAPASTGIADIAPQPNQVLSLQYAWLNSIDCPGIVKPFDPKEVAGIFYYKMPVVSGSSLRLKMQQGNASLADIQQVAATCALLAAQNLQHGDLKPDNILISADGAMLIDPGHFGPLDVTGVTIQKCFITTPAYYPLYQPDDLLALGITFWELILAKHPFSSIGYSKKSDLTRCGLELLEFVQDLEKVGRYSFSSILDLRFPLELNSQLTAAQEVCLLRALRLKRSHDNRLELAEGFGSFEEFADSITQFDQFAH